MDSTNVSSEHPEALAPVQLPRITIKFCTRCKWMLRAAYFAQELLSTFSTSLGEVALIPSTGGVFTVDLVHPPTPPNPEGASETPSEDTAPVKTATVRLWDRKSEGGFPEVKHLKQLVRNHIDPSRNLGHSDTPAKSLINPTKEPPPQALPSEAPKAFENAVAPCNPGSTDTAPLPSPPTAPQQEAQDLQATVPQGLYIGPDPGTDVQEGRIENDGLAGRKDTSAITGAHAGITKDVEEAKGLGGEGDRKGCEECG